jgi:hypothetical protein
MISWPVTIDGILTPARKKLDQYEFQCRNRDAIQRVLPLVAGNPYAVTTSKLKGHRNKGIQITYKFGDNTVAGQFHRHERIWIDSNRTLQGPVATSNWHRFLSLFGITVGITNKIQGILLEFHQNKVVVIRLSGKLPPQSSYI